MEALLAKAGVIPVVRAARPELALRAVAALAAGGVEAVEIACTVPEADQVIKQTARLFPDLLVGAGTVLTVAQAEAAVRAGARFLVSPGLSEAVMGALNACRHSFPEALFVPGALTPSEVLHLWERGCRIIKIFPVSCLGGPAYLRALRGPFPQALFFPTGGIGLREIPAYLEAGAFALGLGSELVGRLTEGVDFEGVSRRAREALAALHQWRQQREEPVFP